MLTARYAKLLPGIRINVADPGMTATDLSGGHGHSLGGSVEAQELTGEAYQDTGTHQQDRLWH
jgi:hypothetical protein